MKTQKLRIGGMTCALCQNKIKKELLGTAGVQSADVSYRKGTAVITYDADVVSLDDIAAVIQSLDYEAFTENESRTPDIKRVVGLLIVIAALYMLLEYFGFLKMLAPRQLAETNMSYGMLFVIGLVTSVHCIAMCGGINLSQCIPNTAKTENNNRLSVLKPSFLYNLGRVVSYTSIGFIVGAIGSAITFSNTAQGILKLIAGLFMVAMGVNMLDIFPPLRRFMPKMPKILARKINREKSGGKSPLIAGLLNGLMPCGPLQAMQIYALSTGNAFAGALSMFLFGMGTVPLMFGLGAASSALGRKFTKNFMTGGAALVVVLGMSMLSQGWSLSGISALPNSADGGSGIIAKDSVQVVNSTLSLGRYPNITVRAGAPVKWIIDAPHGSINGCNNRLVINEYGIEHTFAYGENVIEFTPTKTGNFQYSCWMGMIRAYITVTEPDEEGKSGKPDIDH